MKRTINPILAFSILMVISLTGCLKGNDVNLPASAGDSYLQLDYIQPGGSTINSGLNYFSGGSLTYPAADVVDTATYSVYLGGANTLNKDIPVTIGIDASALKDNYSSDSISYLTMPDSVFKLVTTTGTIKSGERVATFKVAFYPSKFDVTKSFMLPIKVTNTAGVTVSTNYGHIYFHAIGNPLAGSYTRSYQRWNGSSAIGVPTTTGNAKVTFVPDNSSTLEVQSGYGAQNGFNARYQITFTTSANGTFSNFKVVINPDDVVNNLTANSITLVTQASIIIADPVTGHYKFTFQVTNSSGYRTFIDEFIK